MQESPKPIRKAVPLRQGCFTIPSRPKEEPNLLGTKCSKCGFVSFPKRLACPKCLMDDNLKEIPLGRLGKIESFAITRVDLPDHKAPYVLAEVKLPEGPTITSQIIDCEPSEDALKIGSEVRLVLFKVGEDEEGNELLDYRFRPA